MEHSSNASNEKSKGLDYIEHATDEVSFERVNAKVDDFGRNINSDVAEKRLVRKLDLYILVRWCFYSLPSQVTDCYSCDSLFLGSCSSSTS